MSQDFCRALGIIYVLFGQVEKCAPNAGISHGEELADHLRLAQHQKETRTALTFPRVPCMFHMKIAQPSASGHPIIKFVSGVFSFSPVGKEV